MGSCFSFPPKFDLKPPLESWQRSLPLSRVFPSSSAAHAMLSHGWGWQSHLGNITCVLPSRKLLAPPDPRAEGLGFTSLEQHPYYFHSWFKYLVGWPGSLSVSLLAFLVLLACRELISWAGALPSHPSESSTSPCCFFIAVMTVIYFFGKAFFLFCNKEWILTCWQDTGAA